MTSVKNPTLILIVEDDQYIRDSLAELLTDEGYQVRVASDGQEGLDVLRGGLKPRLILLDLMMPIKDGFQFRAEQRQDPTLNAIPVLIFSADPAVNANNSVLAGTTILKKPVDLDELLQAVQRFT